MSQKIQKIADETGKEISTSEIWKSFIQILSCQNPDIVLKTILKNFRCKR